MCISYRGNSLPILMCSSNLDAYVQAARRIPILTLEEEYAYATDLQETGNLASAQKLMKTQCFRFLANQYRTHILPHV